MAVLQGRNGGGGFEVVEVEGLGAEEAEGFDGGFGGGHAAARSEVEGYVSCRDKASWGW